MSIGHFPNAGGGRTTSEAHLKATPWGQRWAAKGRHFRHPTYHIQQHTMLLMPLQNRVGAPPHSLRYKSNDNTSQRAVEPVLWQGSFRIQLRPCGGHLALKKKGCWMTRRRQSGKPRKATQGADAGGCRIGRPQSADEGGDVVWLSGETGGPLVGSYAFIWCEPGGGGELSPPGREGEGPRSNPPLGGVMQGSNEMQGWEAEPSTQEHAPGDTGGICTREPGECDERGPTLAVDEAERAWHFLNFPFRRVGLQHNLAIRSCH